MLPRVQLVVPCYNEGHRFQTDKFLAFLAECRDVALLFVDDGSTDETGALLSSVAAIGEGRISVLTLARNSGKAEAVRRGLLAAMDEGAPFVGYWDADLSTPLSAVPEFLDVFAREPDTVIVMGSRVRLMGRRIDRTPGRHYVGRLFATGASLALGIGVYDTQCGAKLFKVDAAVRNIFAEPFRSRWAFDVEVLGRYIGQRGAPAVEAGICELPLRAWSDVAGSKLSAGQALRAFWDLVVIARRVRRQRFTY